MGPIPGKPCNRCWCEVSYDWRATANELVRIFDKWDGECHELKLLGMAIGTHALDMVFSGNIICKKISTGQFSLEPDREESYTFPVGDGRTKSIGFMDGVRLKVDEYSEAIAEHTPYNSQTLKGTAFFGLKIKSVDLTEGDPVDSPRGFCR